MKPSKAVILAGGKATRLYPITQEIPKPLLPIAKKPIINYLVDLFFNQGITDIAVLINKDNKQDFDWWKKRYYPEGKIIFIEEKEALGTFGGLHYLKDWIGDDHFFFTNGDELKEIDLDKMQNFHFEKPGIATIALVDVPNPQDYGVAICEEGMIKGFLEKPKNPPSNYISSGLYFFSPEIFKYHPGPKFSMVEKDLFPKLTEENKLAGFKFQGKWTDCGTWERYEKALKDWGKN
ncbi:nucleotidyltransferase family protein [Patescibacteria group bacterium]|nr:nucleotidyltransferase family protein [Patescibacteria group bacterium]MBU4023502.1 nucleotidyltransferase family protein [Patescibacteria group bacterium]MBU4078310.1 nucleotidyltransferase family protein [Patescibacteria group bacterium]